ncbi:hypothetical protein [Garciella nitratireducens]|uniref:Uncharacterized protein n=1 Tax=Garciella nitratireducens DSM 15102 TaxID=1121911 RepID=A0A1T4K653_9FIRM|nr:hypothetical protein [Garciella nitratireducens]SJZ37914.1 hypothetical protein SAMN02745973_00367 [Garciella nitratireducens DSM 15102]
MFEIEGKIYEIKYNMKTIEKIENITRDSVLSRLSKNNGLLSISDLKIFIGNALFNEDGHRVSPKQGMEITEKLIEVNGYIEVTKMVAEALQRDCPFLFQGV